MKAGLSIIMSLMASAAIADTQTMWTGRGRDNRWSNPDNWSAFVPTGAQKEWVEFPTGNWTVEIDADSTYNALLITNDSTVVTLVGSHKLLNNLNGRMDSVIRISAGERLVVAGPTLSYPRHSKTLKVDGEVKLLSGTIIDPADRGMTAGDFATVAPPKGASLVLAATDANAISTAEDTDYVLGGSVSVTNGGFVIYGARDNSTVSFTGRGSMEVKTLRYLAAKTGKYTTVDLESLTLGAGGIEFGSHRASMYFRDGIRFGAFADWAVKDLGDYNSTFYPCGDVVFDTLDAYDRLTPHAISFDRVNLLQAESLKVSGGGAVTLPTLAQPGCLTKLELVDDGTKLSFGTAETGVCANSIQIADGATLTLDPMRGQYLDVKDVLSLDAGAIKLVSTLPETPAHRYLVYSGPLGTEPDLSWFDTAGIPAGYTLVKTLNSVYLTDGTPIVPDTSAATSTKLYWVGGADMVLTTKENWVPQVAPDNSTVRSIYFNGWSDAELTTEASLRLSSFNVGADCGPLKISGGSSYIRFGSADAIVSESDYPIVFDIAVAPSKSDYALGIHACGSGSITLLKDVPTSGSACLNNKGLCFSGDVRLGGKCLGATDVAATANRKQPNRLTLLPGAELVTSAQGTSQGQVSYQIDAGASMTVDGTAFAFAGNENRHVVNGVLAVNCPFVAETQQIFGGAGVLKLASVVAAAGGVKLTDGITLVPGDWTAAQPLVCRGAATIAPAANWCFNPGGEVTLAIGNRSTLTVDTGASVATLKAPVAGDGNLVKKGAGALVFASVGNVIDTLTVEAGLVTVDAALIENAVGPVDFLTVRNVIGSITVPGTLKLRARPNLDGTTTYSVKRNSGMMLIFR